ncbi:CPBP family intramembrane metalloprotease [Leucobacter sp. CSA1]|uniref:CPBP family intramembrane metalloprotease n=1 Tax=Leucobacter chromiisoli TaxID=2796471 RepID=A0A934UTL8_9MICO|nr:type II CAAX endopeptidase family protein [Leucobacter chromiisoli]MBK0417501.1 CPBP family intramembrane metalloprotease [Leucobacter chromiisoli]
MTSTGPHDPAQDRQPPAIPSAPAPAAPAPEPAGQPQVAPPPGAPQTWGAWAAPRTWRTAETEPLAYHRLYRGAQGFRWWKPLLLILLAGACFLLLSILAGVIFTIVYVAQTGEYPTEAVILEFSIPDTQNPSSLLIGLGPWALMVPALLFSMWAVGIRPGGRIWSVALKLRWGLVWRTAVAALLMLFLVNAAGIVLELLFPSAEAGAPDPGEAAFDPTLALWSMLIVLLLVPFQAAAEELVFRGVLMQTLGAWLRSPWFGILIPAIGFALAHIGTYGVWGMASVGVLGVTAAWLTWRTGGLEAAISLHVVNNVVVFGLMASGAMGSTEQNDEGAGPVSLVVQALGYAFFVWASLRSFRRGGYGRTRIDLLRVAEPSAPGGAPGERGGARA